LWTSRRTKRDTAYIQQPTKQGRVMVSKRFDPAWYDEPARRMAEGLVEAERRMLAERRKLEDCDCKKGMFPDPGRRGRPAGHESILVTPSDYRLTAFSLSD
jgi:hypothetical protein